MNLKSLRSLPATLSCVAFLAEGSMAHGESQTSKAKPSNPVSGSGDYDPASPQILVESLQNERVHQIPTFPRVTTSLSFPGKIEEWDGAGFTLAPDKIRGDFIIKQGPGNNFLTLTPVTDASWRSTPMDEAIRRNINVRVAGRLIILDVVPVDSREKAAACMQFVDGPLPTARPASVPPQMTETQQATLQSLIEYGRGKGVLVEVVRVY